ncbi:hypothetical protein KY285_032456 [Solanum tuberosum]|nr:hypothetical protein KY285_032456 [Solanum tuberosum]
MDFNSPNPQMIVDVNYKLRSWWIDIKGIAKERFDPVMMVFKFVDFDLALTIEEISGFIDLSYHECEMMGNDRHPIGFCGLRFSSKRGRTKENHSAYDPGRNNEDYGNKIDNHPRRMVAFNAPVGFVDWQIFLIELESGCIQWKLHWLSTPHAIVRGDDRYFIELIGLKGVQPYTPLRALCTREYYIWILKEVKDRELSEEGYYGLTDERKNIWARNMLKIKQEGAPYTRSQLAPSSWNQYLQDFRFLG